MWRIVVPVVASIALAVAAPAADTAKVGDIAIDQPWARASLGNAPNSAAYMILQNTGALPDRLIGGSTPVATQVQLHTHVMEGGVAKMRPVRRDRGRAGPADRARAGRRARDAAGPDPEAGGRHHDAAYSGVRACRRGHARGAGRGIMAGRGPGHDDSMDHGEHGSH